MILGLDTSTSASAACVLRADGAAFEAAPEPQALLAAPAHARELMPAIAGVMEEAQVSFDALEAIAVGVGPGTFTGLRIGIATARALAAGIDSELALPPAAGKLPAAAGSVGFPSSFYATSMAAPVEEGAVK